MQVWGTAKAPGGLGNLPLTDDLLNDRMETTTIEVWHHDSAVAEYHQAFKGMWPVIAKAPEGLGTLPLTHTGMPCTCT